MPPPSGRVLGVFAHPDDEVFCAAALATAAQRGLGVSVLTLTEGERGPGCVGSARVAELYAACAALGLDSPRVLGLPDGGLDAPGALDGLGEELAEWRPDVVLGLDLDGLYAHRDHCALSQELVRLAQTAPWSLWLFTLPRGRMHGVWRRLRRSGQGIVCGHLPPRGLGVDRSEVDWIVDVGPSAELKLAAVAAHASQLRAGDPRSFLEPGLLDDLLREEWYRCASCT